MEIKIVAIEIVEDQLFSEEFSPRLQERAGEIEEEIGDWLQSFLGGPENRGVCQPISPSPG